MKTPRNTTPPISNSSSTGWSWSQQFSQWIKKRLRWYKYFIDLIDSLIGWFDRVVDWADVWVMTLVRQPPVYMEQRTHTDANCTTGDCKEHDWAYHQYLGPAHPVIQLILFITTVGVSVGAVLSKQYHDDEAAKQSSVAYLIARLRGLFNFNFNAENGLLLENDDSASARSLKDVKKDSEKKGDTGVQTKRATKHAAYSSFVRVYYELAAIVECVNHLEGSSSLNVLIDRMLNLTNNYNHQRREALKDAVANYQKQVALYNALYHRGWIQRARWRRYCRKHYVTGAGSNEYQIARNAKNSTPHYHGILEEQISEAFESVKDALIVKYDVEYLENPSQSTNVINLFEEAQKRLGKSYRKANNNQTAPNKTEPLIDFKLIQENGYGPFTLECAVVEHVSNASEIDLSNSESTDDSSSSSAQAQVTNNKVGGNVAAAPGIKTETGEQTTDKLNRQPMLKMLRKLLNITLTSILRYAMYYWVAWCVLWMTTSLLACTSLPGIILLFGVPLVIATLPLTSRALVLIGSAIRTGWRKLLGRSKYKSQYDQLKKQVSPETIMVNGVTAVLKGDRAGQIVATSQKNDFAKEKQRLKKSVLSKVEQQVFLKEVFCDAYFDNYKQKLNAQILALEKLELEKQKLNDKDMQLDGTHLDEKNHIDDVSRLDAVPKAVPKRIKQLQSKKQRWLTRIFRATSAFVGGYIMTFFSAYPWQDLLCTLHYTNFAVATICPVFGIGIVVGLFFAFKAVKAIVKQQKQEEERIAKIKDVLHNITDLEQRVNTLRKKIEANKKDLVSSLNLLSVKEQQSFRGQYSELFNPTLSSVMKDDFLEKLNPNRSWKRKMLRKTFARFKAFVAGGGTGSLIIRSLFQLGCIFAALISPHTFLILGITVACVWGTYKFYEYHHNQKVARQSADLERAHVRKDGLEKEEKLLNRIVQAQETLGDVFGEKQERKNQLKLVQCGSNSNLFSPVNKQSVNKQSWKGNLVGAPERLDKRNKNNAEYMDLNLNRDHINIKQASL